ncbi:hypothetical protein [Microbacterium arborescens]|uniref:hypothetical protein n=1 Tax=Microbacterium arborescens TaxID=33883 RepID=UPI0025A1F032|nr:hypothetical protein [Microbacterium arborescens]WJM16672.1 hypothetical protein QUC20_04990 [Microbacterium arborescens]
MKRASSHGHRAAVVTAAAGSVALLVTGTVLLAGVANAALVEVPETGTPGRLVLAADPYPAEFRDLSPGDTRAWQVQARLEDASSATLALELRKDGDLVTHPRGLRVTVQSCAEEWTGLPDAPVCASGAQPLTVATPADDYRFSSPSFNLPALAADAPVSLLVTLGVEDSPEARADTTLMGRTGDTDLALTAVAIDDTVPPVVQPPVPAPPGTGMPGLPATGGDLSALAAVLALAGGFLAAGLALRLHRREARA